MTSWKSKLKADPTPWLLEEENPMVRARTLTDLLERPPDDPDVRSARAQIPAHPPIAALFAAQKPDGHWGRVDYYLPRTGLGVFWVLSTLGDMGLSADLDPVQRACAFMFTQQRADGGFYRRRTIKGEGRVWETRNEPCTHARIVRFLIQFGYGEDPRVRRAIEWLLPTQRDDGMWFCRAEGAHGCLRATIYVLRVAALDPDTAAHPTLPRAIASVEALSMQPRMNRYHVGPNWGTWRKLAYPHFGVNVVSALDALARLGRPPDAPGIAAGLDYLLSRQHRDGSWPLDEAWPHPPLHVGRPGQPNKWLTLDALRVLKRFYGG